MKKVFAILIVMLVVCLAAVSFAACNDDEGRQPSAPQGGTGVGEAPGTDDGSSDEEESVTPQEALDAVAEAVDALADKMLFGYGVMSPDDILDELIEKGLDKQGTGRIVITVAGEKIRIESDDPSVKGAEFLYEGKIFSLRDGRVILTADGGETGAATENVRLADIVIMVPSADHDRMFGMITAAQAAAEKINAAGELDAEIHYSLTSDDQEFLLEDIAADKSYGAVVILPYDSFVVPSLRALEQAGVPFVMADRIFSDLTDVAVSSVAVDESAIGSLTATRFLSDGLKPGDNVIILPGDESDVSRMREEGFKATLLANGWSESDYRDSVYVTQPTYFNRFNAAKVFEQWLLARRPEELKKPVYIFAPDYDIFMGVIEALDDDDVSENQREALFASEKLVIAGNGESEEVCRVIKGETYTSVTQHFDDIFITTAPVSVITKAILAMADHLNGEDVSSEIRIGVKTLDVTDIADYDGIIWP